ncbi:MAG: CHAT domain-containing protein [Candidatus Aminicenantes bacterium]|nr:CHAT domain-containing protein [Candidatus Aminicenantes bacterium]
MAKPEGRRPKHSRPALSRAGLLGLFAILAACIPGSLAAAPVPQARTIRVPQDHLLISLAVAAARPGDVVEVDDGYYFEQDLVLDKPITIRSKNLFGAVVCGSKAPRTAVFIVRAAVDISGFILKDSVFGLLQRDSPDVEWTGSDLAFFDITFAVDVDDRWTRVGSARLSRLIIGNCERGLSTNEAGSLSAERCLIARTKVAFSGSNHLFFKVDRAVLWDCMMVKEESLPAIPAPGTNRIDLGPDIWSGSAADARAKRREFPRRLNRLFAADRGPRPESADRVKRRDSLLLAMMGQSSLDSGDLAGAESHFRQALALTEAGGGLEARWMAELGSAQTAEKRGDAAVAIERYGRTIDFIESVGSRLPLADHRTRFRKDKIGVYETAIGLLLDRHALAPGEGYDRRAFLMAERSKAQGVLGDLRRAETDLAGMSRDDGRREMKRVSSAISRIQTELQDPGATPDARSALLRRLDKADAERQTFLLRVRQRDPSGARGAPLPAPSIEEIRRELLDESTALLEYVLGGKRSYAFLMTREGLWTAEIPNEGALRPRISNYLRFLTLREPREFAGWSGGRLLRESLWSPFEGRLSPRIKKILIIPDGLLHYLPFETLLGGPEGRRFLVEDFAIGYGPSASVLIDLRRRPAPAGYPMEFLGLANDLPYRLFGLSAGGELRFPSLPYAMREVRSIGRLFPAAKRTILTGRDAGEGRLKSLPLADYRIVHLAAHGFFDDAVWWRSALLLQRDKDGEEDGFLQPGDLLSLRFRPELLVLSGCRTGGGSLLKGEGVMGLSGAFLRSGARSVLISLWSVNDKATARFMASFYRLWKRGTSKPEALRQAKIEALRSGEPPFAWAPFVLIGD